MAESLKHKTVKGVSWSLIDDVSRLGVQFIVGVVLANLLTPAEFGIIGMVVIFTSIADSIVNSGFSSALIQKKNAENIDYCTVFYFNMVLSVLLYVVLYFAAPAISRFFDEPQLISVTRVLGIVLFINALAIVQRTILVKKVDFKTQTIISLISSVISGIIGIGMALKDFGVWSLVGQTISRQGLNTGLLWVFNRWLPSWQFSVNSFKTLFSFGSKLLVAGLIDTIWRDIYYVVIGKYYQKDTLGQYTRARQYEGLFSSNLTSVIQRVTFPVLSSIQDQPARLKEGYRRIIKITMLVTFSCMLGLAAVAKPAILILIGEKWIPCIAYMQILCFAGMLYPLHAINLNMLNVKGRSDLFLKLEIIKKIIAVGPIVLGIMYSIEWMLWGSVVASVIAYFLNAYYSGPLIGYSIPNQLRDIMPSLLMAGIMAAVTWPISWIDFGIGSRLSLYVMLGVQISVGVILMLGMCEYFKTSEYLELKQLAFSGLNKVLHRVKTSH